MDYEQKYNEALEKARYVLHTVETAGCVMHKDLLEEIFPALRESEDERIIKTLQEYVKNRNWMLNGPTQDEVLAWLEKQKERPTNEEMLRTLRVEYEKGVADTIAKYEQKEQKPLSTEETELNSLAFLEQMDYTCIPPKKEHQNNSDAPKNALGGGLNSPLDKDKNLDDIAQDYVEAVKEYNPELTWDLMQTAVCYGYHYREGEEQKPIHPNIKREYIEKRLKGLIDKEGEYYRGAREELAHLYYILGGQPSQYLINNVAKEEQKPVEWKDRPANWNREKEAQYQYEISSIPKPEKPAEWSEDFDEEVGKIHKRYPEVSFAKLTRIAYHFSKWANRCKDIEWSDEDEEALDMCLDVIPKKWKTKSGILLTKWLKDNIHSQLKQEWSEEDEKIRQSIIKDIEFERNYTYATTGRGSEKYNEQINWLKSLRPQPKQEWDEEDEEMLNLTKTQLRILQSHLSHAHSESMSDMEYSSKLLQIEKCVSWLDIRFKSLRPQPQGVYKQIVHNILDMIDRYESLGYDVTSDKTCIPQIRAMCKTADECHEILDEPSWKPSEEQMNRLFSIVAALRKDYCDDMADFLASIYHNLEKLM